MGRLKDYLGCERGNCLRCIYCARAFAYDVKNDKKVRGRKRLGYTSFCVLLGKKICVERLNKKPVKMFFDIGEGYYSFSDIDKLSLPNVELVDDVYTVILKNRVSGYIIKREYLGFRDRLFEGFLVSDWFKLLNKGINLYLKNDDRYEVVSLFFYDLKFIVAGTISYEKFPSRVTSDIIYDANLSFYKLVKENNKDLVYSFVFVSLLKGIMSFLNDGMSKCIKIDKKYYFAFRDFFKDADVVEFFKGGDILNDIKRIDFILNLFGV